MTINEMRKSQLLALVKVLLAFNGEYGRHSDECTYRNATSECSCGFTVSLREVSDAIEGKGPLFVSTSHHPNPAA